MKQVFLADEKHLITHTDTYSVVFDLRGMDGFWYRQQKVYATSGKQRYSIVIARFRRDMKGKCYVIRSVKYQ